MPLSGGWTLQSPNDDSTPPGQDIAGRPMPGYLAWRVDRPRPVVEYLDCPFTFGQQTPEEPPRLTRGAGELLHSLILLVVTFMLALGISGLAVRDERIAAATAGILFVATALSYRRRVRWRARHQRR